MAYIYRHIRLDKNEPFYIGIGSDSNGKYNRAYNIKLRSFRWKDIAKHVPYNIEIILDDLTWEEACIKEVELISLYGRKDLGLGSLVNMTNGGDGQWGRKDSTETITKKQKPKSEQSKQNMKLSHVDRDYSYLKGRAGAKVNVQKSTEHSNKIGINHLKSIIQYSKFGEFIQEWISGNEASDKLKINRGNISNALSGNHKTAGGYIWKYKN